MKKNGIKMAYYNMFKLIERTFGIVWFQGRSEHEEDLKEELDLYIL